QTGSAKAISVDEMMVFCFPLATSTAVRLALRVDLSPDVTTITLPSGDHTGGWTASISIASSSFFSPPSGLAVTKLKRESAEPGGPVGRVMKDIRCPFGEKEREA